MTHYNKDLYEQYARLGKALASPSRIALLELLAHAPRTVESLAQQSGLSIANTSQHLQHLRQSRLVRAEKQGLYVTYQLLDDSVRELLAALHRFASLCLSEVREIDTLFQIQTGDLESVDLAALQEKLNQGVTLLDVRPQEEFDAGHLPGAICIPLPELVSRLAELPQSQEIIAYCRGPYCVMALQAVQLLLKEGYSAAHFRPGIQIWREQHHLLETGL